MCIFVILIEIKQLLKSDISVLSHKLGKFYFMNTILLSVVYSHSACENHNNRTNRAHKKKIRSAKQKK